MAMVTAKSLLVFWRNRYKRFINGFERDVRKFV
jgi:hypothetical protein